jgi:hypothetical protein
MGNEDFEDIVRVLSICYRGRSTLDAMDLERVMSFDMEWMSPAEAEKAVQALIGAGWLTGPEDALSSTAPLDGITSPLGWFPRPSRLLKPISFEQNDGSEEQQAIAAEVRTTPLPTPRKPVPSEPSPSAGASEDPRARLTPRLTKFIAKQSQLGIEEVERRAHRKAKALTYASHWVCLALVAREQGLVMDDITAALSVY